MYIARAKALSALLRTANAPRGVVLGLCCVVLSFKSWALAQQCSRREDVELEAEPMTLAGELDGTNSAGQCGRAYVDTKDNASTFSVISRSLYVRTCLRDVDGFVYTTYALLRRARHFYTPLGLSKCSSLIDSTRKPKTVPLRDIVHDMHRVATTHEE